MEHDSQVVSVENFLGAMERLKRWSFFFLVRIFQMEIVFHFKPFLISVSEFCCCFLVNGTDLCKW